MNELSKEEREVFEDRIKRYEDLRTSQMTYFQSIFIGLWLATIVYVLTDIMPEFTTYFHLPLLITKGIILVFFMLLTLFVLISYRKSILQTQKPVAVSLNTIGTLEGYRTFKRSDGKDIGIAYVSDTIEDNPIDITKTK